MEARRNHPVRPRARKNRTVVPSRVAEFRPEDGTVPPQLPLGATGSVPHGLKVPNRMAKAARSKIRGKAGSAPRGKKEGGQAEGSAGSDSTVRTFHKGIGVRNPHLPQPTRRSISATSVRVLRIAPFARTEYVTNSAKCPPACRYCRPCPYSQSSILTCGSAQRAVRNATTGRASGNYPPLNQDKKKANGMSKSIPCHVPFSFLRTIVAFVTQAGDQSEFRNAFRIICVQESRATFFGFLVFPTPHKSRTRFSIPV
jgi:hypothetical protein